MNITVPRKGKIGDVVLEAGEYIVGMSTESGTITLTGRGHEHHVPSARRPAKRPIRRPSVSFVPSGGVIWTLTYQMPPKQEWVAFIHIEKKDED